MERVRVNESVHGINVSLSNIMAVNQCNKSNKDVQMIKYLEFKDTWLSHCIYQVQNDYKSCD